MCVLGSSSRARPALRFDRVRPLARFQDPARLNAGAATEDLDLDSVYALHLFHSQSAHLYRYASAATVRGGAGNFFRTVRRVFESGRDTQGLQAGLLDKLDEYPTAVYDKMRAHARKFGVELGEQIH